MKTWEIEIQIFFSLGTKEYEAGVILSCSSDPNFGEDADGNRGMTMDFIDNVDIKYVVDIEEQKYVELTEEMEEIINFKVQDVDISEDY